MEPDRQIEIQLGHMCNNRCVFCVSGQRTALGEAGPMPVEPILARIREARAAGHSKITLLGGEPTLQPGFLRIVEETVALGFSEIVLFTNGAKTARAELIDAVRATGGRFTWRISIQGATRESHERTTKKDGSFGRIVRTLEHLAARGERITVNMCVVSSNYEDVDRFPELLAPYGVGQLHLDMVRPLDAGDRSEEELRAMIPRYSAMAEPLRRMVAGFEPGFDVNVGNLPYCVAPDLAPWIHHDGQHTDTIAIDGDDQLSRPWNKYLVKRRDKLKPESCRACALDARCSGVFETYAAFYGTDELRPVDARALARVDPRGRLLGLWLPALVAPPLHARALSERAVLLEHAGRAIELSSERRAGAAAAYERFSVYAPSALTGADVEVFAPALALLSEPIHPLGPSLAAAPAALVAAVERLRAAAPFGALRWRSIAVEGARAELALEAPDGAGATLWIELAGGKPRGGYRVDGEPTEALASGLRAVMAALASRAERAPAPPPVD